MARGSHRAICSFSCVLALIMQMIVTGASAAPGGSLSPEQHTPDNHPFGTTWARTDKPVADGAVSRTWMWGPHANTPVMQEEYADSPGQQRDVQYYDKSRMEITNPSAVDDGLWYVTNGLLVVELMTGRLQVGNDAFVPRQPAQVNVAGDPDDPLTYATFAGRRFDPPLAEGAAVTQRIIANGSMADDPSTAGRGVTGGALVVETQHTVASVFWAFMNSSGLVEIATGNEALVTDQLFINPFYATGYPVTEAYWANVKVAGTLKDVLIQCFERRCLTWTPDNPPGWQVEAGNVGQHYYRWRYEMGGPPDHVVINEVMFRPEEDEDLNPTAPQWVELHNPTSNAVNLSGWRLTNAARDITVLLPGWTMPAGGYLIVQLDAGENDEALGDICGVYHAGESAMLGRFEGGVALYSGAPGPASVVDFVAWSYEASHPGGQAHDDAVAAGKWAAGAYYNAFPQPTEEAPLVFPLDAGAGIGRDNVSVDTDSPADWIDWGGRHAFFPSPCGINEQETPAAGEELPAASGMVNEQAPQKKWTVIFFYDARDPKLSGGMRNQVKQIERAHHNAAEVNIIVQQTWVGKSLREHALRWVIKQDEGSGESITSPFSRPGWTTPGNPEALKELITWSKANYPAERYAIVLSGHGNGWKGLFTGNQFEDHLNMGELRDGLSSLGQPFDLVVFQSCLMAQVEVAAQIHGVAHYMVASEEVTWDWDAGEIARMFDDIPDLFSRDIAIDTARTVNRHFEHKRGNVPVHPFDHRVIAAIDVNKVKEILLPLIGALGQALYSEMFEKREPDVSRDNSQVIMRRDVRNQTETFMDANFLDLADFARRTSEHLPIPRPHADAVHEALTVIPNEIVIELNRGFQRSRAHGLSIYFPEYMTVTRSAPPPSSVFQRSSKPFDNPLFDPLEPQPGQTHLYRRDPNIQLSHLLLNTNHAMADDRKFLFPFQDAADWAFFLHFYYKPKADACFVLPSGTCTRERQVRKVGETVTLNGKGSSDSDTHVPVDDPLFWWWDFNHRSDPGGAIQPVYQFGQRYDQCVGPIRDNCDRNNKLETLDYADAAGSVVTFTCTDVGVFVITLWVHDDHHTLNRQSHEDPTVNGGHHWVHFQVSPTFLEVVCVAETGMFVEPSTLTDPDESATWYAVLVGNPKPQGTTPYVLLNPVPTSLDVGEVYCSTGECGYEPQTHQVRSLVELSPEDAGKLILITFETTVKEGTPSGSIENCGLYGDISQPPPEGEICATLNWQPEQGAAVEP